MTKAWTLDADFPGGNIIVDRIDGDDVYVHQALRDTTQWWFYWYFRVRGAQGRTLHFHFTDGDVLGTRGPAISRDQGVTWAYQPETAKDQANFSYTFTDDDVHFCFAIPYLEANLKRFISQYANNPGLESRILCKTRAGRDVEVLYVGASEAACLHKVLLTSRHHACESIATYAMEGLIAWVLSDRPEAQWMRTNVRFMCVPFVDKDGVEQGDQGKLRHPRDHNRDYSGESLYASTRTLRQRVPVWSEQKLRIALDMHCPWIRGPHNEVIYFVGSPDMENWAQVTEFATLLEHKLLGPLPYHVSDNLSFGQAWNTDSNATQGRSCGRWTASLDGINFGTSIEIPYASVGEVTVTAEKARTFGADLALAMVIWLQDAYDG